MMSAVEPEALRDAMSRFPTGVTVVSSVGPAGPAGATANAVASLSLEPPLMLACLDLGSRTLVAVEPARLFSLNWLSGAAIPKIRRSGRGWLGGEVAASGGENTPMTGTTFANGGFCLV